MLILETGTSKNIPLKAKCSSQAGFTLLEILLVIVMVAVTAAMVVPSISNISQGDIKEESSRLRLLLVYGLEEAQLSGLPVRFLPTKQGWSFETYIEPRRNKNDIITVVNQQPQWQALVEPPLEAYVLPDGISITQIEQVGDIGYEPLLNTDNQKDSEEPVLGIILLLPDGTTSISNIDITDESDTTVVLQVRPGPAGIQIRQEGDI